MKSYLEETIDDDKTTETLPLELERCRRELAECQKRLLKMEGLFEHRAEAVFGAEPDGRIIEVNPAACALLGYSNEELVGMRPWDFVASASRDDILRLIDTMPRQVPITVQRTYRSKTGEHKLMDLRLTRCDPGGRDLVVVSCRDVTEQKAIEDRLRQSERNLAEGQRLTKTGSWILSYKTGNTDWSVETCRIFGFPDPPPSPHYREFRARVRPEDREGVDRGLRESFETGEPRPLKYVFILPNGVRKHIETISQPMRDAAGELKLMGTVMDVTERVQAEEDLRASEKCARGQAEALAQALEALAREPSPDKIVEHVLRTITAQLDAHSSSVWLKDESTGLMNFESALEGGQFRTKADATLAAVSPSLRVRDIWPWPEVFRTGRPYLLEDIRKGVDFPWRAHVLAQGIVCIVVVPMLIAGVVQGVIGIRFTQKRAFRPEEMELAQALAHQAMLAMQLNRLSAQSLQTAVLAERNRLARDLHDSLAQGFTGVIMQLEAAKGAIAKTDSESVRAHIERAEDLARASLGEARRSVRAMRPRSLLGGSLNHALDDLLKRMTTNTPLQAEFVADGENRAIPPEWEEGLLRIAQESLTNTIKYAQARRFRATLGFTADSVRLQLVDDGRGFDPRVEHEGFGLLGMRERTTQMAGNFVLRSETGQGTEIVVTLSLPNAASSNSENQA